MPEINDVRVLFMGTPDFAVPSLQVLIAQGCQVIGVVTQPDRPKGRKRELVPTPVKAAALLAGLTVFQPEKLRAPDAVAAIAAMTPDLIVTAAYGQILPKQVLDIPKYGCINVHGSLLPQYRGGAPIQHAIMNGDAQTGVTIMYMAEGLDTGDMLSEVRVPIAAEDDAGTIFTKLSSAGAELLQQTLRPLLNGELTAVPQNNQQATYAPTIKREDERIDWSRSAVDIHNQIRGLRPFTSAFTYWHSDILKVWDSRVAEQADDDKAQAIVNVYSETASAPGQDRSAGMIVDSSETGLLVKTGQGGLWLLQVQPAGKKAMPAAEFARGNRIQFGTVLGGMQQ